MAPSVSYSITVRLEVASRGRAVSEITRAVEQADGVVTALDVTAFLLHLGGKIEMRSKVPLRNRDDLSMAYTPGVGRVALANPDPEVDPEAAREYAAVVATGRSDYPNQINNVLAFPGVFRGLLDAQSRFVTDDMLIAAARALADVVSPDEIGPHYIIPSVFHPDVASSVAVAVRDAATRQLARS
jgi:malic enzyme